MIKTIIVLLFFNDCEKDIQLTLQKEISNFYHCRVDIMSPITLPRSAYYAPRNRYKADSLLRVMDKVKKVRNTVSFTTRDISTKVRGREDWGVFGLASLNTGSAVVSTYRLSKGTKKEIHNRILNIALHELGHSYRLPHCPNRRCLMADKEGHASPNDVMAPFMCEKCLSKLLK